MEDPKWLVYLNIVLGIAVKLAGTGFILSALWKAVDWIDGKVQYALEEGKKKANQFKLLQQTEIDDHLWEELKALSFSTFKTLKGSLEKMLEDGQITQEEFRTKLHADVKANFKKSVSTSRQKIFKEAYEDLDAVIDVLLPGVVKEAKAESRAEEAAKAALTAGKPEGNS